MVLHQQLTLSWMGPNQEPIKRGQEQATPTQLIKIAVQALDNPVTINSAKLTAPTLYQMVQKSVCPCFCKVKPASVTYLWLVLPRNVPSVLV